MPPLHDWAAFELIVKRSSRTHESSWSIETPAALSVRPVQHNIPDPRVTSVPVAFIVGGVLIASLGITQRIRRSRTLES